MVDIGLLRTFFRELTTRGSLPRGLPPTASLPVQTIIEALDGGGNVNGRYAAGYLYHTARISQTIAGANTCVDLGGAPGCQLHQLATVNRDIHFIGVDKSEALIRNGQQATKKLGIKNVEWVCGDISKLACFDVCSVDAVISTMTLHDLPTIAAVRDCLRSVSRILKPDGAVYIEDYGRLKSRKSMDYFNRVKSRSVMDPFGVLNDCSLRAAFTAAELRLAFADCLPQTTLHSTFLVPFLNVAKTADRPIGKDIIGRLKTMRDSLDSAKRDDLDDLCHFFALGGWKNNPFK